MKGLMNGFPKPESYFSGVVCRAPIHRDARLLEMMVTMVVMTMIIRVVKIPMTRGIRMVMVEKITKVMDMGKKVHTDWETRVNSAQPNLVSMRKQD